MRKTKTLESLKNECFGFSQNRLSIVKGAWSTYDFNSSRWVTIQHGGEKYNYFMTDNIQEDGTLNWNPR